MFDKILIANRSEIARRVMSTCREMGIGTVAVFSEHDASAPFVSDADEAVALQPDSGYLDVRAIVEAALAAGADAVHPGYGFLAENADFASAVEAAGMTFLGPTPETIASMGSKLHARGVAEQCGVPVLPHAELDDDDAASAGALIGYPLLVKASSGGGGKGMRIVREESELNDAVESAVREAEAVFGDGTVYLERYIDRPRHVEVQILGDGVGNVVHLHERECSTQRRFQKVIEEAPAPNLDIELRNALWDAAVAIGQAEKYRGAGTVEFIVTPDGGFFFLEVNTRLQVEHPVTELTTGVDLVRMQIEIAAGEALPEQTEIPPSSGWAIEARLNAESPADAYRPSTGVMHRFSAPKGVRVDTGVADGTTITHHYDALIAKFVSHASTREEAAARLAKALTLSEVHGVATNRDQLVRTLRDPEFLSGSIDTHYLERRAESLTSPLVTEETLPFLAAAAAIAVQAENRSTTRVLASMPSGYRNMPFLGHTLTLVHDGQAVTVTYRFKRDSIELAVDGNAMAVDAVYAATDGAIDISIGGIRRVYRINIVDSAVFVDSAGGSARFDIASRFPVVGTAVAESAMVSTTPGSVVAVHVAVGDVVAAGETVMVIEAMKMERAITTPKSGRVAAVGFAIGDQVDAGTVLVELEADDE